MPELNIAQPEVYLVGTQTIDEAELNRFLADEGVETWETDTDVAGQKLVEVAGRTCYMSFSKPRPGGNKAYLDHILEVGHGSVCEHAVFNLLITGVSRSFTHELIRHRAGFGYSQLSQRYVDESDCRFVCPPLIANSEHLRQIWEKAVGTAQDAYEELSDELYAMLSTSAWVDAGLPRVTEAPYEDWFDVDHALAWVKKQPAELRTSLRKQARETARSVLPNATETKIFITGNARALRHFLELRASAAAEQEIRRVAVMCWEKLRDAAPNLFGDYVKNEDGALVTPYRKV